MPRVEQEEEDDGGRTDARRTSSNEDSVKQPADEVAATERDGSYQSQAAPVHVPTATEHYPFNDPRARWSAQDHSMARQKALSELPTFVNHFKRSFQPSEAVPIDRRQDPDHSHEPPYKLLRSQEDRSSSIRDQSETTPIGNTMQSSHDTPWDAFLHQAAAAASNSNKVAAGSAALARGSSITREPVTRTTAGETLTSGLQDPHLTIDNLHGLEFTSFEAALAYGAKRIPIQYVHGDDHDVVSRNPKSWVLRLKSCFAVPPKAKADAIPPEYEPAGAESVWADWQNRAQVELMKRLGTDSRVASKRLEGAMWQLLAEILAVHCSGVQQDTLWSPLQQRLKCTERLEQVIIGLAECAKIRADVLVEAHHRYVSGSNVQHDKRVYYDYIEG